jgi:hypothetical protein
MEPTACPPSRALAHAVAAPACGLRLMTTDVTARHLLPSSADALTQFAKREHRPSNCAGHCCSDTISRQGGRTLVAWWPRGTSCQSRSASSAFGSAPPAGAAPHAAQSLAAHSSGANALTSSLSCCCCAALPTAARFDARSSFPSAFGWPCRRHRKAQCACCARHSPRCSSVPRDAGSVGPSSAYVHTSVLLTVLSPLLRAPLRAPVAPRCR